MHTVGGDGVWATVLGTVLGMPVGVGRTKVVGMVLGMFVDVGGGTGWRAGFVRGRDVRGGLVV